MKLKQNKKFNGTKILGYKTIEICHIYPSGIVIPKKADNSYAKYYVSCMALTNVDNKQSVFISMADIEDAIESEEYLIDI